MSLRQRIKPFWARRLALLLVIGPGMITDNVDSDAGGSTVFPGLFA